MIVDVFQEIFTSGAIFMVILGTAFGIILGAIPGLGAGIGITVLIPFTYSMEALNALLLLAGVFMGCGFGGSISGILLNIPGTAQAVCTTLEGYPMLSKGRGKEALYLSAISSTFGGVVGVVALILFAPMLARVALKFGPPEMMLVAMVGLTIIASLSADNFLKGIFGACFGILIAMIGIDAISGSQRFTFGVTSFSMGIKQIGLALGLIAGREALVQIHKLFKKASKQRTNGQEEAKVEPPLEVISCGTVLRRMIKKPFGLLYSSTIGTFVGILPGAGAAIAAYVAYGEAKRMSKEEFGTGVAEGIIAAESANNAAVGGTFVPMLALGIPGSASCALIFSALTVHGIAVGPNLFVDHAEITYGFMFGLLFSVLAMGILAILCTPFFAKIVKVDMIYIIPAVVGSVILGVIIEKNLSQSITIAGAAEQSVIMYMLQRPLCIGILIVGVLMMYANMKSIQSQKKIKKTI